LVDSYNNNFLSESFTNRFIVNDN